jgi:hypothetical protein
LPKDKISNASAVAFFSVMGRVYTWSESEGPSVIMDLVKEPTRHTVIRRSDEPKLEIGDTVSIREGVVGVVLTRYIPSGTKSENVHYIVEIRPADGEKA